LDSESGEDAREEVEERGDRRVCASRLDVATEVGGDTRSSDRVRWRVRRQMGEEV